MGKLASAALTVAAPEAKVASRTASAGRRRRAPLPDPRVTAPGSTAARQRQAVEDIKARRPAEPAPAPQPEPTSPPPASPGGGPSLPVLPAAAQTGSGFLLGLFAWACGLAYLRGGAPEVKRFLAAKFFNKTSNGG